MIIAVDYDGTLWNGEPNMSLISQLIKRQRMGDIIILWTCREGERLLDALKQLQSVGLRPNYANQNCPQAIKILGRDSRKIYADMYIDDKGVKI